MKSTISQSFARLLRRMANACHQEKPLIQRSTLSITRTNGAVIGTAQWVVQALLDPKVTPHPHEKNTSVYFPQWDIKTVSTDSGKKFELEALVTTLEFSSFRKLTGTLEIRPGRPNDRGNYEWILVKAEFNLKWYDKDLCFLFDEAQEKYRELTHVETHFRYYFERLFMCDNKKQS
jgi:hypothetical protein